MSAEKIPKSHDDDIETAQGKRITVPFDAETHAALVALATKHRRSLVAEILWLVDQEKEKQEKKVSTRDNELGESIGQVVGE